MSLQWAQYTDSEPTSLCLHSFTLCIYITYSLSFDPMSIEHTIYPRRYTALDTITLTITPS